MPEDAELCPLCAGAPGIVSSLHIIPHIWLECSRCGAQGRKWTVCEPTDDKAIEEAVFSWNFYGPDPYAAAGGR